MQSMYIDAKTFAITTADPRNGDGRPLTTLSIPEGMSALEALGVLQGWVSSFRGLPDEERRTVALVQVG